MGEWINKEWCVYTVEYHSAVKGRGVLIRAVTWMNLGNIMLPEGNQAQKVIYCIKMPITGKSIKTDCRLVVARSLRGWESQGARLDGYSFLWG